MKVAKVRYNGRKGPHSLKMPDGERIRLRGRNREDPWVGIEEVEHARVLEDKLNYEVEWTAVGRLRAHGEDVLELGYQAKRKLASKLDLDFDGQPDEETLDDAIQEYIDQEEI